MPTKSIIEEAVIRLAEKKADAFFEQFDSIKAHLQKVWDAEKPKFDEAVENDEGNGVYLFPIDLSEFGPIDKTQAEAVLQSLPSFQPISYWIDIKNGKDEANPQKFEVAVQFAYQRERAIKDVMNERIEKRRSEERQKEWAAEREAEAKRARVERAEAAVGAAVEKFRADLFVEPAVIIAALPEEGQAILESALAGLGYNVDPGEIGTLADGWTRALLNEFDLKTSAAFKAAYLEACDKCHKDVSKIMETVENASIRASA